MPSASSTGGHVRGKTDDQILRYRLLCERLRDARKAARMSQEMAAAALGRPQSYIAKTERAERRVDLLEVQAFVELYALDANALFAPMTREERTRLKSMEAERRALKARWAQTGASPRRGGRTSR